jgi:hypothetical protein
MITMTVQNRKWCVYSHSLHGDIVYVGVGTLTRPFERTRRNAKWTELVGIEPSYEVTVHLWTDDRREALRAEADLITRLKPRCNDLMNGYTCPARNRRVSETHKGKTVSPETRGKISVGRIGIPNGWQGRSHTEQAKGKIRLTKLCYPIRCVQTGKEYPSIASAAASLSVPKTSLRMHLRGDAPHVRGMTFERVRAGQSTPVEGARHV